jgi:hypothetical protein
MSLSIPATVTPTSGATYPFIHFHSQARVTILLAQFVSRSIVRSNLTFITASFNFRHNHNSCAGQAARLWAGSQRGFTSDFETTG